jgi:hypothetical protein
MAVITFKKQNRSLWDRIQSTDIKYKKECIGAIHMPIGFDSKVEIRLMFEADEKAKKRNPNCAWMWVTLKQKFDSEEEARKWVKDNEERVLDSCYTIDNQPDDLDDLIQRHLGLGRGVTPATPAERETSNRAK